MDFAERQNTFSFSASFGNIDIKDEYIKTYKRGLNHLGAVSVREESGRQFVNNLTEREVTLLLDPTLYLPQEKWKSISKRPESVSTYKKYVLIYFLGGMSDEQRNIIENFANINNCIIVDAEDYSIKIGPNQFIWLIDHAEFIFTDSFHGCAFSIIFRKKFVVFNRKNYSFDMSDRITTLLDTFSISYQFINTDMYSFDTVNNIINKINDKKLLK